MTATPNDGSNEETSTPLDTITALLEKSGRSETPLRRTLVQQGKGKDTRPGPLAGLVTARDHRALLAYLLVVGVASAEPWMAVYPAGMWARALHLTDTATPRSARAAVSKVWARLERHQLLGRGRVSRKAQLQLLDESGNGEPYVRPNGIAEKDRFFSLPHAFWLDGYYRQLDLPALAVLLIALHEKPVFQLPAEKAVSWYGISADTVQRGIKQLRDLGLLTVTTKRVKAPLSDTGSTTVHLYSLAGPFVVKPSAKKRAADKNTAKKSQARKTARGVKPAANPILSPRPAAKTRRTR